MLFSLRLSFSGKAVHRIFASGGVDAAVAYEHRYGIVPDDSFPTATADDEPSIEAISAEKFEQLWQQGRQARERLRGHPHE